MSSEIETIKTNEFLQRRKLRILQVREQSKDIAKKIRQRTKLEKLRHIVQLDANKEKEYLRQQEKLVEELERQYASGLKSVGTSHKSASDLKDSVNDKVDLSKARAKAAAVQLRQKKQKDLDEKKQLLDRKLQAREVANELSREKSATVSNKIKFSKITDNKTNENTTDLVHNTDNLKESDKVISDVGDIKLQNDMATQWDSEALPNAVTPVSYDNVERINLMDSNHQHKFTKKINLFALSDEMPSSLRGGSRDHSTENTIPLFKPSSVISEYLQNRGMRLRETEPISDKSSVDDLQNIKKTIIQSRLNRPEGNTNKICDVVDNEVIPVPSWHAEPEYQLCLDSIPQNGLSSNERNYHNKLNSKKIYPNPVLRGSTPFRRTEISSRNCSGKRNKFDKPSNQITSTSSVSKNNSVTMYNHSTRDARNVINHDDKLVVRDLQDDDDAYSQALKETTTCSSMVNNGQHKKLQDVRHKVAVSKQKVQKEYEDTIAFLKSLPKESDSRPIKKAYMPDYRIQQRKDTQQQKMQFEFKKIEKECLKKCNMCSSCNVRKHKKCTKSSVHIESNDDVSDKITENVDFTTDNQYSWIPVPESDNSLAIHKIPNSKDNKTHSVKFDDANTYHEYRSRHKHTPPTKDETVLQHENRSNEATHNNSLQSETSSNENTQKEFNHSKDLKEAACAISDSDRIIIYKILDSERSSDTEKQSRKQLTKNVVTSLTSIDKEIRKHFDDEELHSKISVENKLSSSSESKRKSFELLTEGVYKTVRKMGDNITTLYYSDEDQHDSNKNKEDIHKELCNCGNSNIRDIRKIAVNNENDKETMDSKIQEDNNASIGLHQNKWVKCSNCIGSNGNDKVPESSVSNSSYKTATEKAVQAHKAKLIDSSEKEPGNFYIGASGYLKDNDFEVIIQLRKKETCSVVKNKDINQENNYVHSEPFDVKVVSSKDDANVNASNESQIKEPVTSNKANSSEEPHENNYHCENGELQGEKAPNGMKTSSGPGISTYTQTSMYDSPVHRPVYLHMSSSTSTTYMSPPDKICPKLLNRIYDISEKVVPFKDSNDMLNVNEKITSPHEQFQSDNFKNKKYNKSKDKVKKKQRSHTCNKPKQHKQVSSKKTTISHTNSTKMTKIISDNEIRNKFQHIKSNETNLHPLIKNYVHKVLNLNKEGIKAVEVATQYCSSVSTPESSVINISSNIDKNICANTKATITLEQIKNLLQKKVSNNSCKHFQKKYFDTTSSELEKNTNRRHRMNYRKSKYRHKVKSLNISKKLVTLFNSNKNNIHALSSNPSTSSSSHLELNNSDNNNMTQQKSLQNKRSKSNPSPRPPHAYQLRRMKTTSDIQNTDVIQSLGQNSDVSAPYKHKMQDERKIKPKVKSNFNKSSSKSCSNQNIKTMSSNDITKPANISTQTNENFVYDTLNRLQENKIQNMEKIANLTEKCTKRLSDLAKVLQEVRKNKSTAYCKLSNTDTSSDADQTADKNSSHNECATNKYSQIHDYKLSKNKLNSINNDQFKAHGLKKMENVAFAPIFEDIPKPFELENSESSITQEHISSVFTQVKARCKPPVALSRINLKLGEDNVVPHELSTVIEIESPISLKIIQSPTIQTDQLKTAGAQSIPMDRNKHEQINPHIVQTDLTGEQNRLQYIKNTSLKKQESSKLLSMMDLSKFNDIMFKPFVSPEEYAKQCNIGTLDEGSNLEDFPKDDVLNDEISSLHSDGSLPDVISELLKRNLMSEPFRYDSLSNANSTTISSGSSASMLILSKNKKKANIEKAISKKVDIVPTDSSDSPSISSNPDLENAFKKLGMGWASSTLKKTKERLALSSSTSTSTSNTSYKFQVKKRNVIPGIPIPALISDSLSKELSDIKISYDNKQIKSRNLEQKTLTKSMTVKDFLTNELANKITFTNNSEGEETEQHFTSLYSTKLPIASADGTEDLVANQSMEDPAHPGSRQRTSTPVQLFKSLNYNTNSSSYNNSNGLFSNIDDLSSVKVTSSSLKNSNTDKDDLSIPNYSLKLKRDKTDHSKCGD